MVRRIILVLVALAVIFGRSSNVWLTDGAIELGLDTPRVPHFVISNDPAGVLTV